MKSLKKSSVLLAAVLGLSLAAGCSVKVRGTGTGLEPLVPPGGEQPHPEPQPEPQPEPEPQIPVSTGAADAKYVDCKNSTLEIYADLSHSNLSEGSLDQIRIGTRELTAASFTVADVSSSYVMEMSWGGVTTYTLAMETDSLGKLSVSTNTYVQGDGEYELNGALIRNLSCTFLKSNIYGPEQGF